MHPVSVAMTIDRESGKGLFEQIYEGLRQRIMGGEIVAGDVLPPTRSFATDLGVSRATVLNAYEQLIAEGLVVGQRGAGYRVCADVEITLPTAPKIEAPAQETMLRHDLFRPGTPDLRLFPHRAWAKTVARMARVAPDDMLGLSPRFGHADLRAAIAQHVAEWRGLHVDPAQVIVTAGASDALEMTLRSLCQVGDQVGLEDPGFQPILTFVQSQGLKPQFLKTDAQGAQVPAACNAVILTPSQQFPLGGAMAMARRAEIIAWAQESQGWIIEDDYDSEFRYAGRPIPALASLDANQRTIYIGSFSKIFANGLRLGYVIVPHKVLDAFEATQRRFGTRASLMPQAPLAAFMQTGEFYRHLRRVRRVYGGRRKVLMDGLLRDFSDVGSFTDHQAGMQIAFHLKPQFRDHEIADRATAFGLGVEALCSYSHRAGGPNGLLLGFCGFDEAQISSGLEVLRKVFDAA